MKNCIVTIAKEGSAQIIKFDDKKCQDMLSIKEVYEEMTGKELDEKTEAFINLPVKYQVYEVALAPCQREATFRTKLKTETECVLIPGTNFKVRIPCVIKRIIACYE